MNSERNILSRLLEGCVEVEPTQPLDEKTYTVGETQYWKRSGKFYSWTSSGGRKEISEDEYMKAISGGSPKNTEPKDDAQVANHLSDKHGADTVEKDIEDRYDKKSEYTSIEQRRNSFYDDSESDYVNYNGVSDFDHTTWEVEGQEATIQRNSSGRGYYLQTEDYDAEFDTKGDLVHFLRSRKAEFVGEDSDSGSW